MIRYASVCDGIGAVHVATRGLPFQCAWTSEIDPFPAAVVDHHFQLPNLGDMLAITSESSCGHGPIDMLVGGTPCQSFSFAGLRTGLDDPRGNLALRFCQLARLLRPRWVVWENVPGVLSSNKGRDFKCIADALVECGYGLFYRVLDAQFVRVDSHARAVPQRRRRVFVVGHSGGWGRAAAVLLDRASLRGDSAPRREAGKGVAGTLESHACGGSFPGTDGACSGFVQPVANTLTRRMRKGANTTLDEGQTLVAASNPQQITSNVNRDRALPTTAPTLHRQMQPCVAHTLRAEGHDASEDETGRGVPIVPADYRNGTVGDGVCGTLEAAQAKGNRGHGVMVDYAVRRLTPMECERLQGFPDRFTAIDYRGKPASDSARYKALGNSMAVNVMRWIMQRVAFVDSIGTEGGAP